MPKADAPFKAILLGEHAVLYGQPAVAVAVEERITVSMTASEKTSVGDLPLSQASPYIQKAIELAGHGIPPVRINVESRVPAGSGFGSSAALSVAMVAALKTFMKTGSENEKIAREAFRVELEVQEGRASPTDTSTSTAGGAILIDSRRHDADLLWKIEAPKQDWYIHRLRIPKASFVAAYSGTKAPTTVMVERVAKAVRESSRASTAINEIGRLTRVGIDSLRSDDLQSVGKVMNDVHENLKVLGVSTPRLDELVEAARPHSYGAKLTGAGGGGFMVALTDHPERVVQALKGKGCDPITTSVARDGVRVYN